MMTKVLITGAKGQLAKTLKNEYSSHLKNFEFNFVDKESLDITNFDQVSTYFKSNTIKYCINCAAYTYVEQAEEEIDKAFLVNAEAVKNLAKACRENNVVLIHISTDYVFDGRAETPYLETDITNPINQYGASKLRGEEYIRDILGEHFIIRTSWLYSKYSGNFLTTIINKIKSGSELKITTSQRGTPTSSIELSRFILFLIEQQSVAFGTYHFSSLGETTWYHFGLEIASYYKDYNTKKIKPTEVYVTRVKRPEYSVLSNAKALNIYGRKTSWETQLREVIQHVT